jgi:hypothetical protein
MSPPTVLNSASARPGRHTARFVPVPALDRDTRERMCALYLANYDGSSAALFHHDLDGKEEALLVWHDAQLVGFTTLRLFDHDWHGQRLRIVYSGDTVVDRAHWGQQALAFAWIRRMGAIKRACPDRPLYWLLLVKGHRTYRYLPAFARDFYPHWRAPHDELKPLVDALATRMFATDYRPASGLIEFPTSHGHLKADLAQPAPDELARDSVRFFLARNPGYTRGHEMVCLCAIEPENLKPLTRRLFEKDALATNTQAGRADAR